MGQGGVTKLSPGPRPSESFWTFGLGLGGFSDLFVQGEAVSLCNMRQLENAGKTVRHPAQDRFVRTVHARGLR